MIELIDGSYLAASAITAIRVLEGWEYDHYTTAPRVCIDFTGNTIVANFETIEEAKSYAQQINDSITEEAPCKK